MEVCNGSDGLPQITADTDREELAYMLAHDFAGQTQSDLQ